jgi:hypothetical protein
MFHFLFLNLRVYILPFLSLQELFVLSHTQHANLAAQLLTQVNGVRANNYIIKNIFNDIDSQVSYKLYQNLPCTVASII